MSRTATATLVIGAVLITQSLAAEADKYEFPPVSELPLVEGLPDVFRMADGSRVKTQTDWKRQREYLKAMLAHYQYGPMPPVPEGVRLTERTERIVMDGQAEIIQGVIRLAANGRTARLRVGILRPAREGRYPVIVKNDLFRFDPVDFASPASRKSYRQRGRFETEEFVMREAIRRGYVICKFIRTDFATDRPDERNSGVYPLYPDYDWGTIAVWAWAHSVVIDALEREDYIDPDRIAVTGHSRGGKTALCAGIYDDRIAVTAPNSSGAGGTASWRFFDSEQREQRIAHHVTHNPMWWSKRMYAFAGEDDRMPFDAHFAKALIAPRALVNPHARQDYWANPYGTYLTHLATREVYAWMGVEDRVGLHWRNGGHNQNEEDWRALFDFCDHYFFNKPITRPFNENPFPEKYKFNIPYARKPD